MGFDGLGTHIQTLGDVFRGVPFCDELQDFTLAYAELGQLTRGPIGLCLVGFDGIPRNHRRQICLTPAHGPDGRLKFSRFCAFQQVARSTCLQGLLKIFFVGMDRQQNHSRGRRFLEESRSGVKPVQPRLRPRKVRWMREV